MSSPQNTIQSLKTVDQWIDTINANINGGVRTGFKSSRLKFTGTNVDVDAAVGGSLPLQFAETALAPANTVLDFTQGAITASTENTHLAIQGDGFFLLASPDVINTTAGANFGTTVTAPSGGNPKFLVTRDGEFRTDANGFLVNANGYYLVSAGLTTSGVNEVLNYAMTVGNSGLNSGIRAVYNDLDNPAGADTTSGYVRLSTFLANTASNTLASTTGTAMANTASILKVPMGTQSLQYSQYGSTIWDFGYKATTAIGTNAMNANIKIDQASSTDATILSKSLEASNASMTQSVPELSLAQKLFSALTKVLQTEQTNQDSLLSLIR